MLACTLAMSACDVKWPDFGTARRLATHHAEVRASVTDRSLAAFPGTPAPAVPGRVQILVTPTVIVVDTEAWERAAPWGRARGVQERWWEARGLSGGPIPVGPDGVDDAYKRGQLVSDLYEVLLQIAETHKGLATAAPADEDWDFRGEILLSIHPDVRWQTVREVAFTAGQAQFGRFEVEVEGGLVDWVTPGDPRWSLRVLEDGTVGVDRRPWGRTPIGHLPLPGIVVTPFDPPPPPDPTPEPPSALRIAAGPDGPDLDGVGHTLAGLHDWLPEPAGVVLLPDHDARWGDLVALSSLTSTSPQVAVVSTVDDADPADWTDDPLAFAVGLGEVPALLAASPELADRVVPSLLHVDAPAPLAVRAALEATWDDGEEALTLTSLRRCVLPALDGRPPTPGALRVVVSTHGPRAHVRVDPGPLPPGVADCLTRAWRTLPTKAGLPPDPAARWWMEASTVPPARFTWDVAIDGGTREPPPSAPAASLARVATGAATELGVADLVAVARDERAPLRSRGAAIVVLQSRPGAASALDELAIVARPELVALWAAAGRLHAVRDARELPAVAALIGHDPSLELPFAQALDRVSDGRVRPMLALIHDNPEVTDVVGPRLAAGSAGELATVALRDPDPALRLLATRVVGGRPDALDAWLEASDPETHRAIPWRGGPLFVPTLDRHDPRTAVAFDTLIRWWWRCEPDCGSELELALRSLSPTPGHPNCGRLGSAFDPDRCLEPERLTALKKLEGR